MEGLVNAISGLRIENHLMVTIDDLRNIIKQMEEAKITSLPLKEVLESVASASRQSSSPRAADFSTPSSEAASSPKFTFQTPSKPFTPFVFKGVEEKGPEGGDKDPDMTDGEPVASSGEKPQPANFFETARNSIPNDIGAQSPASAAGGSRGKFATMASEWATGVQKGKSGRARLDKAEKPQPAQTIPVSQEPPLNPAQSGDAASTAGGWFWSKLAEGSKEPNGAEKPVTFGDGAVPKFSIGASKKKAKSKSVSSSTESQGGGFEFGFIPSFQSAMDDKQSKPTPQETNFLRSFTLGTGDILHSLRGTQGTTAEKAPGDSNSGELEDDEMSWSPPMNTMTPPTTGEATTASATAPQPAQNTAASSSGTAAAPTAQHANLGNEGSANGAAGVNANLSSTFEAESSSHADPAARAAAEDLAGDFSRISFQLGASDTSGTRSAKKAGRRKEPVRRPRTAGSDRSASPTHSVNESHGSPSHAQTPSVPHFTFESQDGSVPTASPTFAVPSEEREPMETPRKPSMADSSSATAPQPSLFSPSRRSEASQPWWQPQTPRKALATPRKSAQQASQAEDGGAKQRDGAAPADGKPAQSESDINLLGLAELYSKQGKELYGIGLYDRALDAYTKCLNLAPKNWPPRATILGNRAAVYFMLQQYRETVNDCDDALKMDNGLVKLLVRKGKALIKMGLFNEADAAFSRVLEYSSLELLSPEILQTMDEEERALYQQTVDSAKMESKAGIREVSRLREAVTLLIGAEGRMEFEEVLKLCDDIQSRSPQHRASQIAKANALCELSKYDDAKLYMEEATRTPIARLYAHSTATFPFPTAAALAWTEDNTKMTTVVDLAALQAAILCMGSELAQNYLSALKNVKCARSYSQDVMNKIMALLESLQLALSLDDKADAWSWVGKEVSKMKEIMALKATADMQFKAKSFRAALQNYSLALKVDPAARRWCAILFSNRAAANMSLGNFAEAVHDCHNAISKDADYCRAYLRRARAFRAMNKMNDAIRDYRRYLCSDPVPSDFKDVQQELDDLVASNTPQSAGTHGSSTAGKPADSARASNAFNGTGYQGGGASRRPDKDKFSHTWQQNPSGLGAKANGRGASTDSADFEDYFANFARQHSQRTSFPQAEKPQPSPRPGSGAGNGSYGSHNQQYKQPSGFPYQGGARKGSYKNLYEDMASSDDESKSQKSGQHTYNTRSNSSNAGGGGGGSANGLFSLTETDHYTVLGVDTVATEREIKMSYRKLALQFHPDKNKEADAEERFKKVSLAYSVLSDKALRREYDLSRPVHRYRR